MQQAPTGQLAIEEFEQGMALVGKADAWIAANRNAWAWMNHQAATYAAQGRRFSIGRLAEDCRYEMRVQGVDSFNLNNDIRAVLARKMLKAHPNWGEFMAIRQSKADGLV